MNEDVIKQNILNMKELLQQMEREQTVVMDLLVCGSLMAKYLLSLKNTHKFTHDQAAQWEILYTHLKL